MKINLLQQNNLVLGLDKASIEKIFSLLTLTVCRQNKWYEDIRKKNLDVSVEIMLVDDFTIKKLNAKHRDKNKITDVLSFPNLVWKDKNIVMSDLEWSILDKEADEDGRHILLGSIVLNFNQVLRQAEEYNHSLVRELAFLYVHSLLHLTGWDHIDEQERIVMENIQDEYLEQLGFLRSLTEEHLLQHIEVLWPKMQELIIEEKEHLSLDYEILDEKDFCFLDLFPESKEEREEENFNLSEELSEKLKVGFIAILGRANTGKSTLLNYLSGIPLAIVSQKAQTTRHNIKAVYDDDESQIIFIDTPGLHKAQNKLGEYMNDSAWYSLEQADLITLLMDATRLKLSEFEEDILKNLKKYNKKAILVINKCDAVKKETLLPFIKEYSSFSNILDIIPISARKGEGIDTLLNILKQQLPEAPRLYPRDFFTDQTERQLAAEYIREQILHFCHDEIPHGTGVIIDRFEEVGSDDMLLRQERSLVRIFASILVDKETHKSILIGKGGSHLKRIGTASRKQLEEILDSRVFLELHVKVRPNWRNKKAFLDNLGYQTSQIIKKTKK